LFELAEVTKQKEQAESAFYNLQADMNRLQEEQGLRRVFAKLLASPDLCRGLEARWFTARDVAPCYDADDVDEDYDDDSGYDSDEPQRPVDSWTENKVKELTDALIYHLNLDCMVE
jgi:hypothetical protein